MESDHSLLKLISKRQATRVTFVSASAPSAWPLIDDILLMENRKWSLPVKRMGPHASASASPSISTIK